jgi:hypothetical protein
LLLAGDPDLRLSFRAGEVVRLWLTNTANTRVFNVTLPGARVTGDRLMALVRARACARRVRIALVLLTRSRKFWAPGRLVMTRSNVEHSEREDGRQRPRAAPSAR